jgi:hypothetical protein
VGILARVHGILLLLVVLFGLELAAVLLEVVLLLVHVLLLASLQDLVLVLLYKEARWQGAVELVLLDQYEVVEDNRFFCFWLLPRLERARM